ncbi:MAG TPA: hypothetical protein VEK35_11755, partial [Roseiarcus sp.]|nr:hypothetical protein [Roseiarcus sp.]
MAKSPTSQAKLAPDLARADEVRFGIGFKLFGAFAAVASLTLLASVVAYFSYSYISQSLYRFEIEGMPTISQAQSLARRAAELSAISSTLIESTDDAQLAEALRRQDAKRAELAKALDDLHDALVEP